MVFDNAEDPRALAPLLPHGPGRVLITSRNPGWRGLAAPVGVAEFRRDESAALLRKIAPGLSEPNADRVAAAVGDLPLAVEQAGAMIRDAGLDVETYLRLLRERAGELLAHDWGGVYPVSVAASWAVAFDRLSADDPTALDLLTLIAWCGPEPVPLDLLIDHPAVLPDRLAATVGDPLALGRCTGVVSRRAMATLTAHSIQVHRVPAALLRDRTRDPHRDREGWAAVVARLLRQALPEDVWNNPVVWPRWQQLLPHVLAAVDPERRLDEIPDEVSLLLNFAAGYRLTRGEPRAALPLFQRGYATRRAQLGDDHPDTLTSASNLAIDLRALGRHQQAHELDEDTLTRRRRVLGDDHPDTLTSASNLAIDLRALGRHQQAHELDEDTLTRRQRVLGDDHPDTLTSASNLAGNLAALGRHQQAHDLDRDTLTRLRRVLGDDHPDTLASASNLAADLAALGRHQQAHDLDRDTLTRRQRVLGDDHPDTFTSASNLARDLFALGRHQQAHDLDEDTLTRRRRVLGDDHPSALTSASNLARDLRALGQHQQADGLEEQIASLRARSHDRTRIG